MSSSSQFCTFLVDNMLFGVPVLRVQEVLRHQQMTPVPLAPEIVRGLINLRGQIVTAIDMRRRLRLPPAPEPHEPMNMIIRTEEGTAVSLLVDEIGDVLSVDDEQGEVPPESLRGPAREIVRTVYKLNARLLLEIDPQAALSLPQEDARERAN